MTFHSPCRGNFVVESPNDPDSLLKKKREGEWGRLDGGGGLGRDRRGARWIFNPLLSLQPL